MEIKKNAVYLLLLVAINVAISYTLVSSDETSGLGSFWIIIVGVSGFTFSLVGAVTFVLASLRLGWQFSNSPDLNAHRKQVTEIYFSGLFLLIGALCLISHVATSLNVAQS